MHFADTVHWHFDYRLCCVYWYPRWCHSTTQYFQQDSIDIMRKMFLTICPKRTLISVFEYQFWSHFHHILPRYQSLQIPSTKFIIATSPMRNVSSSFEPFCTSRTNVFQIKWLCFIWKTASLCSVLEQIFHTTCMAINWNRLLRIIETILKSEYSTCLAKVYCYVHYIVSWFYIVANNSAQFVNTRK